MRAKTNGVINAIKVSTNNYIRRIHFSATSSIAYEYHLRSESLSNFSETPYIKPQNIVLGSTGTENLVERPRVVKELISKLNEPRKWNTSKTFIIGPDGSGKSVVSNMLVSEYIKDNQANNKVTTSVIFEGSLTDFEKRYKKLASMLGILVTGSIDQPLISDVNKKLELRGKPLFVFDDIDKVENITKFIDKITPSSPCEIVMTARKVAALLSDMGDEVTTVDLNSSENRLTKAEALDLVNKTLGKNHHEIDCNKRSLAERSNYSPGLIIATVEFATRNCISFRSLFDKVDRQFEPSFASKVLLEREHDDTRQRWY